MPILTDHTRTEQISDEEYQALTKYLGMMRADYWFANHVLVLCEQFAAGKRYTPAETIQHLVGGELNEFDCETEITKNMLRDYPELFEDDLQSSKAAAQHKPPAKQKARVVAAGRRA